MVVWEAGEAVLEAAEPELCWHTRVGPALDVGIGSGPGIGSAGLGIDSAGLGIDSAGLGNADSDTVPIDSDIADSDIALIDDGRRIIAGLPGIISVGHDAFIHPSLFLPREEG